MLGVWNLYRVEDIHSNDLSYGDMFWLKTNV